MSVRAGRFAYAQARIQARLGQRITALDLQRARAARDLPAYLQQVRSTSLARHVARIAPDTDVHEIERRMREQWGTTVEEVARWQAGAWRPATLWLRWLPYLPALQKLARGGRAPAWTREDSLLARVVARAPGRRASALGGTVLAPLQRAVAAQGDVTEAWLHQWRSLWPHEPRSRIALERWLHEIVTAPLRVDSTDGRASSADTLRALGGRFLRAFRRHPLSPVAVFAWLGLEALDQLELRGAIAMRQAFA